MTQAFAPLQNDRFLRALSQQPVDVTPLWLMRQAGRYLPEYRATRKQAGSFMDLAKSPEFATEVTLQPIDRYGLDAAILFSDILTVPDAMGLGLYFAEGEGPRFERSLQDEAAIQALSLPPEGSLDYVYQAVTSIRHALNGRVPLIGFTGSPWTLACYMVEGQGSREFHTIKKMLYSRPDLLHKILTVTTQAVITYLNKQIEAGAQAVMIFDSWGGALAENAYETFSLSYMRQIIQGLHKEWNGAKVPAILFTKGGGLWLEAMAESGADALGLDWTIDYAKARQRVGTKVALQGNLDPAILLGSPEAIAREAKAILKAAGDPRKGNGHVFNLGHGISQFTPPENVQVLVDTVHNYDHNQD